MANLKKFTTQSFANLTKHCFRERLSVNVNPEKSTENYNLCSHGNNFKECNEYFKKRLSEIHVMKRSDVKTNCTWTITAPADLPQGMEHKFFEVSKEFLDGKYDEINNLYATVHMDEATPHMHYSFIPSVPDLKHGGFKVSAFELLNKSHLKSFHLEYGQFLRERGFTCDVNSGITRLQGGNRSIKELKAKRPLERQQELSRWENNNLEEYDIRSFFE